MSLKYLAIDEEGFPLFGEVRVADAEIGHHLLSQIRFASNGSLQTELDGETYVVEAFDAPLVIKNIQLKGKDLVDGLLPYGLVKTFSLKNLSVDEWDRFHGYLQSEDPAKKTPFVLSRAAQAELFQRIDSFDDESITCEQITYPIPTYWEDRQEVQDAAYWTKIYQTETPGWEMNRPAPALVDMLPRLKLPKLRVLVLGCGSGNDAAYFAQEGHVVTAVDVSSEALTRARQKYSHLNIRWVEQDLFKFSQENQGSYDLIFEHTCFCAINPLRRNEMVKSWMNLLTPGGFVLAVLFTMERKSGPPFGGSEWEYRERLKKYFRFLFWGRWKNSIDRREGKELLIYAQKK
jgi:SAM-dependent methyltransferase